jgi:hypothetical protein
MKLKALIVLEVGCGIAIACLALPWMGEGAGFVPPTVDVDLEIPNLWHAAAWPGDRVTLLYNNSGLGAREVAIQEGLVVAAQGQLFHDSGHSRGG